LYQGATVQRLIIPNYHVILIHYPLALLGTGLLIEIFSFLWRRGSLKAAGRWMIFLGALALVPASASGAYALFDIAGHGQDQTDSWQDLKDGSGFSDHDWALAREHILLNSAATGLALLAVVGWVGASDHWRRVLYVPALLALIAAMGLMTDGAWHGGEMVFRKGFGVEGNKGVLQTASAPEGATLREKIDVRASPRQLHVIMAGILFAISAGALALSIRRSVTSDYPWIPPERLKEERLRTDLPPSDPEASLRPISLMGALNDTSNVIIPVRPVPAGRFWLLATLAAILTIFGGLYIGGFLVWPRGVDWGAAKTAVLDINTPGQRRIAVHIVFAASILLLTLILAILARWAPKARVLLGASTLVLVMIMAAQVWMGILLLYDGDTGPLKRFKSDQATPATQPMAATQPSVAMLR
jgi:uncharacterized membrane protein